MAARSESDNHKPDAVKPNQADDSYSHALSVFAQSLAYTATEAPARLAAKAADQTFGTKLEAAVQTKFANIGIHQPESAAFGTKAWTAQQLGTGVALAAPLWLAHKATGAAASFLKRTEFEHPMPAANMAAFDRSAPVASTTAHSFDLKFAPIQTAWNPATVESFKTVETRFVDFVPAKLSTEGKDWDRFHNWGIDRRAVPANVYRFPGLNTEIVVPSDYAAILDDIRKHRFTETPFKAGPGSNPEVWIRSERVLPEEMAQMLMRMPKPELATTVQLLDHGNPWDLQRTNERIKAAEARGEVASARHSFVSQADATPGSGAIRVFDVTTNNAAELHDTGAHEWAHLLERDPAYKAFEAAAHAERGGFFASAYSRENDRENWAVHLGERFLHPSGAAFAELPEKAPARTLVMAKAVRNMLNERAANPGPYQQQFLARVDAAEATASANLQAQILADMSSGDTKALADKLNFLNVAATKAQSPEIFDKVLTPIKRDLLPLLYTSGPTDREARQAFRDSVDIAQSITAKRR